MVKLISLYVILLGIAEPIDGSEGGPPVPLKDPISIYSQVGSQGSMYELCAGGIVQSITERQKPFEGKSRAQGCLCCPAHAFLWVAYIQITGMHRWQSEKHTLMPSPGRSAEVGVITPVLQVNELKLRVSSLSLGPPAGRWQVSVVQSLCS